MFNRGSMLVAMLAAAAGLPYVFSSSTERGELTETNAADPLAAGGSPKHQLSSRHANDSASLVSPSRTDSRPVEGPSIGDLSEILNFGVTPQWIMARWPRVSAALSELDLHGYRVVLVTGTGASDLAGSLTYYFTPEPKLRRITLFGTTGDPRKLIDHLAAKHNFVRVNSSDPALTVYRVQFSGQTISELRIKPAQILRGDALARFEVALVIERPSNDGTFMDLLGSRTRSN
jgi:hypothetical protein